jgi:aspartyl protease family protein
MSMRRGLLLLCLLIVPLQSWAAPESVEAVALFADKAMLAIDGENLLLTKGETRKGVTLISSSGRAAVIRIGRKQPITLRLNDTVGHGFRKPRRRKLRLYSDPNGMFRLQGRINGRPTRFLLDTGATYIAMSSDEAERLKLPYRSGRMGVVQTANSRVPVWHVKLSSVSVGDIQLANIEAVVLQGSQPDTTLLGMSFLEHLRMQRNGSAMVLERKY